jgi:peptidyl-prolyl cis-trans isomerase SurA
MLARLLFAATFLALLAGCQSSKDGGDVMAKVDGHKILRADVEKYYANQTAGSEQQVAGEQATSLRLSILRELIDNEILMRRAEKLGLLATDEEVERKLNEIKSPYTQEQFAQRLKDKKITLDDFKRDLRRSLTVHKAEFNLIEQQYHIAQILVTAAPSPVRNLKNDKAQNEADARKKIQTLTNRLDSGEDFGSLAMNYSEDGETASNGGDLGFTPESALRNTDPLTRDAVMKLKPGQYSPVITVANPATKQVFGFRVVKLVAKEPAGQRELSDPRVQQAIREQIRDRREQLIKAAYYEVLRDQAKVENYFAEEILKNSGTK